MNIRYIFIAVLFMALPGSTWSQNNYITHNGTIKFYSHTPVEDIKAVNKSVGSILNSQSGELVITLRMTDFKFKKSLMQRHFNDKFVESRKFPEANFKGNVVENDNINYALQGSYEVTVTGSLTIHGVTKKITEKGRIRVSNDRVLAESQFIIRPEDYNISIPGILRNKIAEEVKITVELLMTPMQ